MSNKLSRKVLKNVNKQYVKSLPYGDQRFWVHKTIRNIYYRNGVTFYEFYLEHFAIKKGTEKDWEREYYNVFRNLGFYDNHFVGEFIDAQCQGSDFICESELYDYINELKSDEHNDTDITLAIENEFFY